MIKRSLRYPLDEAVSQFFQNGGVVHYDALLHLKDEEVSEFLSEALNSNPTYGGPSPLGKGFSIFFVRGENKNLCMRIRFTRTGPNQARVHLETCTPLDEYIEGWNHGKEKSLKDFIYYLA